MANCSIRLVQPACVFEGEWTTEALPVQSKRSVEQLHSDTTATPLLAPAFCFCFTLLQRVLDERRKAVNANDDVTMLKALAVLETHAKLRQDDESSFLDEV